MHNFWQTKAYLFRNFRIEDNLIDFQSKYEKYNRTEGDRSRLLLEYEDKLVE